MARLAGRKRTAAQQLVKQVSDQVDAGARRNPTRLDLVEKLRQLIDDYNRGSLNVDELLRRLQSLSRGLSEDEQRTAAEGLSESELAVFDLLTKPDPVLTVEQRAEVKKIARKLMEHITERLVLDWRKKAETREAARSLVKDILDELPDAYDKETWERKSDAVFNHIFASYYDDGQSVYDEGAPRPDRDRSWPSLRRRRSPPRRRRSTSPRSRRPCIEQIKADPSFAEQVAEQLRGKRAFFAVSSAELIAGEESLEVEFKSTAQVEPAGGAARTSGWRTPSSRRSPGS